MGLDVPTESIIHTTLPLDKNASENPPALQRYSEILKEVPEIEDVVESYASLNKEDRAEKYSYSSRIKDDTAI